MVAESSFTLVVLFLLGTFIGYCVLLLDDVVQVKNVRMQIRGPCQTVIVN